jgi:hypothetical protein
MIKQAIVPRRVVYGRTRIGGIWAYVDNSSDNKFLYLVLVLCDGPIKAISQIYFDDQIVDLDENNEGTGKWAGKVRIKQHLGSATQTADDLLVNDSDEWTSEHTLKGVAYLSIRLQHDPNIFPNGLPNVSAVVEGRNDIVDGRDDSTGYTSNPAWCLAHYLSQATIGPNVDWNNEIDHDAFDTAADICDEQVSLTATDIFTTQYATDANQLTPDTQPHGLFNSQILQFTSTGTLPAGLSADTDYYVVNATKDTFEVSLTLDGTPVTITNDGTGQHTYTAKEYRYTFNGVVNLDKSPEEIMRQFRDSFAGVVCYIGGKWAMYAGAYQTPTFTITEDILSGPISFKPRRSKRDRYNYVKGFFMTHHNRWNPADYPPVTNSAYETADGEELIIGLDLPATATPQMAQRIAKIELERGRMERSLELRCNIEALRAQAGRTVKVDLPRYHIDNQTYRVDGWALEPNKGNLDIVLNLTEESSSVYDWTSGSDEQSWAVPAEPALSDGRAAAPTGLELTDNPGGRELVEVFMEWDATTDEFILQGGLVVIQWKKSSVPDTDNAWQSITGSPYSVEYPVKGLEPGVEYDFRVAWRNKFGGQSDWATELNHLTAAASSSAYNYKHTQSVPSNEWIIRHNLGYRPSVGAVFDHEGNLCQVEEATGTDADPSGETEIKITSNNSFYGTAYLS